MWAVGCVWTRLDLFGVVQGWSCSGLEFVCLDSSQSCLFGIGVEAEWRIILGMGREGWAGQRTDLSTPLVFLTQ